MLEKIKETWALSWKEVEDFFKSYEITELNDYLGMVVFLFFAAIFLVGGGAILIAAIYYSYGLVLLFFVMPLFVDKWARNIRQKRQTDFNRRTYK